MNNLFDIECYELDSFKKLHERFVVPPYSIIDTRASYFRNRKIFWDNLTDLKINGRHKNLITKSVNNYKTKLKTSHFCPSTSIFNPVICEVMYKWFNIDNGNIIDPFAGGITRGFVANKLKYNYTGIDLSKEQILYNKMVVNKLKDFTAEYINGDSLNVLDNMEDESFDFLFTCPPYFNLEKYTDDKDDLSNMEYCEFLKKYNAIICKSVEKLKNNRFACFVVSDIRDEEGFYINLVSDTINAFKLSGIGLYNNITLIEELGSAFMRASRYFNSSRKVVKVNQSILVFYKGNVKDIKKTFNEY